MRLRFLGITLALPILLLSACSSDDDRDGGTTKPRADGSVDEDGSTSQPGDGSTTNRDGGLAPGADAQPGADAGPMGPCNAVTGTGCSGSQACIYASPQVGPQCRDPAQMPKGHTEACNPQLADCAPGYVCAGNATQAVCVKVCTDNSHCMNLANTGTTAFSCKGQLTHGLSVCLPDLMDACDPNNDQCGMGMYCQLAGDSLQCIPEGTANVGENCAMTNGCRKGGMCLSTGAGQPPTCYDPCDAMTGMGCPMNQACQGTNLSFGICRMVTQCTPVMDTCPMGQACLLVAQNTFGCAPEGTAATNQPCPNGACQKGNICVGSSQADLTCKQACDATHPCPNMGMCQMLPNLNVGVCP